MYDFVVINLHHLITR